MSLTSQDETDLILPLFRGMDENPRFSTFLDRLRRRTEADYVGILIRSAGAPPGRETEFSSGIHLGGLLRESGISDTDDAARPHFDRLRPGRVYAADEIRDLDPEVMSRRYDSLAALGIRDERVVRIAADDGLNIVLTIARSKPCSAADSALLSNLAPYVAAAMRNFIAAESQRVASAMAAEGLGRSGVGWILFGQDARVLEVDPATQKCLREMAGIDVTPGERLRAGGSPAERELAAAAAEMAGNPDATQRAVVLCEEPRIEAILQSANAVELAGMAHPAMLAMCRLPKAVSPRRPDRLARLFDLPPREAELAIALADGLSIAEAAEAMGLTIETARNYSKRLYAKLGVRGQAELVRLVYESSAVLA